MDEVRTKSKDGLVGMVEMRLLRVEADHLGGCDGPADGDRQADPEVANTRPPKLERRKRVGDTSVHAARRFALSSDSQYLMITHHVRQGSRVPDVDRGCGCVV